jgi:hypothetical protein
MPYGCTYCLVVTRPILLGLVEDYSLGFPIPLA